MRFVVLLLLLINLGLLGWRQWPGTAEAGREPERLQRELAPEKLRIISAP